MERKSILVSSSTTSDQSVVRVPGKRSHPPSQFLLRIDSYSLLAEAGIERIESSSFEAGGYKWKLIFYPLGNGKEEDESHVSLYLAVTEVESLPFGWEISVVFKLFVHDQLHDTYVTPHSVEDEVKRFYIMKTEWDFGEFMSHVIFKDEANGYLVNDACVFGADVTVLCFPAKYHHFTVIKYPPCAVLTWKLENFSNLNQKHYSSPKAVTVGGMKWNLLIYPRFDVVGKGKFMSVFLQLNDGTVKNLELTHSIFVNFEFRLIDHFNNNHLLKRSGGVWFSALETTLGYRDFVSLEVLKNKSNGYIANNVVTVECQFLFVSQSKISM